MRAQLHSHETGMYQEGHSLTVVIKTDAQTQVNCAMKIISME